SKFSGAQQQEDKVQKLSMKSADEILMSKIMKEPWAALPEQWISALMSIAAAQAQKSPQDMDRFIDVILEIGRPINIFATNALRAAGDVTYPFYVG
ncbi:hypothetical protein PZH42_31510, partial [Bacteroides cellulosilyticus]